MKKDYKKKFRIAGETIKTCWDFREECRRTYGNRTGEGRLPCEVKQPTTRKTYTGGYYIWRRDESRCPFPINQPSYYTVALTEDGEWQCSCPVWIYRRRECKHIRKVKENPSEYEISTEFTGKTSKIIEKLFQ